MSLALTPRRVVSEPEGSIVTTRSDWQNSAMPFIELRSLRFYYERRGSGPKLLVFNGSGGDLRNKPSLLDGPLAQHFETLCHDQRGLGQTDRPNIPYTMADYADDAAALLAALGWTRCRVMGVSFGGMVAQEFAIRHPEKIERMVLACTSSGGAGGASYPLHELAELPVEERGLLSLELADTRMNSDWRRDNPEASKRTLASMAPSQRASADEEGREIGAARQMEARRGHDTWKRLPEIKVPVLCCGGHYDGIAPPENMEHLAHELPNSQLEFFDGGHLFLLQDPRAWDRIIDFLKAETDSD